MADFSSAARLRLPCRGCNGDVMVEEGTGRVAGGKTGAGGRNLTRSASRGRQPPRVLPRSMGEPFPHTPLFDSIPQGRLRRHVNRENDTGRVAGEKTGAGGRNRTDMESPPEDFESSASTSFTTPAHGKPYPNLSALSMKKST